MKTSLNLQNVSFEKSTAIEVFPKKVSKLLKSYIINCCFKQYLRLKIYFVKLKFV